MPRPGYEDPTSSHTETGSKTSDLSEPAGGSFRHEALFYAGDNGFLAATVPFLRDALAADDPTLVVVAPDRIRMLRSELGDDGAYLMFADMRRIGVNPARIIPEWREFVDRHSVLGRPMRGIGEPIWAGRGPAELTECHRHEALLNLAFSSTPSFRLACLYDTAALDPEVIEDARRTHPFVGENGDRAPSPTYDPERARRPFEGELAEPKGVIADIAFGSDALAGVRKFVWVQGRKAGLDARRAGDLVLAASELATNSIRHAGGGGTLRMWRDEGSLLCEVRDEGSISEPLAGRMRPPIDQLEGRGLWLVNQVCDLVQVRSSKSGTVVRASMRLG